VNRRVVIVVSLILALVFTFAVIRSTNVKYASLKKMVDAVKTTQYIPAGSEIRAAQVITVKVPEAVSDQMDFVKNAADVMGKAAKVSLVEGQLIFQNAIDNIPLRQNMREVHIPVDISSSAAVIAGDTVDVFAVEKSQLRVNTEKIYAAAKVVHSFDQSGNEISPTSSNVSSMAGPPGSRTPVSVALEVSEDAVKTIVTAAANKNIYLVKTLPGS